MPERNHPSERKNDILLEKPRMSAIETSGMMLHALADNFTYT